MVTKKDIIQTSPGLGSLTLLITILTMGGFPSDDNVTHASIDLIESKVSTLQIQTAALTSDVKHNENLMEKQSEQYTQIMSLLMHMCQVQASSTGSLCPT